MSCSSSETKPHVGVVGFELWIETFLNLATATSILFNYERPDGTTGSFTAAAEDRAVPGAKTRRGASYTTQNVTDFDQSGKWQFQVHVAMPGFTGPGEITTMEVGPAL